MTDIILFGVHLGDDGGLGLTCINIPGLFTFTERDNVVHNIQEALSCYDDLDSYIINITQSDFEDLDDEDYDCFMVYFREEECIKMFLCASDCNYVLSRYYY